MKAWRRRRLAATGEAPRPIGCPRRVRRTGPVIMSPERRPGWALLIAENVRRCVAGRPSSQTCKPTTLGASLRPTRSTVDLLPLLQSIFQLSGAGSDPLVREFERELIFASKHGCRHRRRLLWEAVGGGSCRVAVRSTGATEWATSGLRRASLRSFSRRASSASASSPSFAHGFHSALAAQPRLAFSPVPRSKRV